ncbi:unnamed protein product [Ostreobium quekettii]|uniref:Uncharacterized protein n=1 Tax=Ostreobium quekettii TaxID=121088 RepID=A0A8S1J7G4_9CHLO|nr:unnamed protein product [Ostreobium quekettii]
MNASEARMSWAQALIVNYQGIKALSSAATRSTGAAAMQCRYSSFMVLDRFGGVVSFQFPNGELLEECGFPLLFTEGRMDLALARAPAFRSGLHHCPLHPIVGPWSSELVALDLGRG